MSLFPAGGLAEAVVLELYQGPLETELLLKVLEKKGWRVTKQGVYKALKNLRDQEIALLHRGEVSLNVRWLARLERFVSLAQHAYFDPSASAGQFANLREGERIVYSFKNPVSVDTFWNHVLYILFETLPNVDRWFAYSPHHWFLLAHRKEELALMKFMAERKIRYLFTAGHRYPLDRFVAKDFDGTKAQYCMKEKPLLTSSRLLFNVVGDFVIEAQYDARVAEAIEAFYASHQKITQEGIEELEKIVKMPGRVRFSITRNRKKAEKWKKVLEKDFYVKASRKSA
jgi:hypothetical protein